MVTRREGSSWRIEGSIERVMEEGRRREGRASEVVGVPQGSLGKRRGVFSAHGIAAAAQTQSPKSKI